MSDFGARSDRTAAYYDTHAADYVARTAAVDMSAAQAAFLRRVPAGAHLVDAGCGSGRDTLAFVRAGYRVTAYDGSATMARLAAQHTGLRVVHCAHQHVSLATLGLMAPVDGIWASATLLHLTADDLPNVLHRLHSLLAAGAPLMASFKTGIPDGPDRDGRWFTNMTADRLHELFSDRAAWDRPTVEHNASIARPGETQWLAVTVRRAP